MAIAALVMAIGLWIFSWIPFVGWILGFVMFALAIVFGFVALSQIGRSNGALGGRGLAIAALVLAFVGPLIAIVLSAVVFVLVSDLGGEPDPAPAFTSVARESDTPGEIEVVLTSASGCLELEDFEWYIDGDPVPPSEPSRTPGGGTRAQSWCIGDEIYLTGLDGARHEVTVVHDPSSTVVRVFSVQL